MLHLSKGICNSIEIKPRWPDKEVVIEDISFQHICRAQASLPSFLKLVITRAYQPEKATQKLFRAMGRKLFVLLYPQRHKELEDIFGHNGHAADGRHIDIRIKYKERYLAFLPLSVFTPLFIIRRNEQRYKDSIQQVKHALVSAGFHIHPNPTEALQIHCDLI